MQVHTTRPTVHTDPGQTRPGVTLKMPGVDKRAVGRRIRQAREQAGFPSQEAFGGAINAHRNTVSAWERGEAWNIDTLELIAEKTGVEWEWLLHGEERIIDQRILTDILRRLENIERRLGI